MFRMIRTPGLWADRRRGLGAARRLRPTQFRKPLITLVIAALVQFACGADPKPGAAASPPQPSVETGGDVARTHRSHWPPRFGFRRSVEAQEIAEWDIDVMPDGRGLPLGVGTVARGAELYASHCARCHGENGVEGPYDVLVGRQPYDRFPFADDPTQPKTIGSYWPYATTLFDYIRRSMPIEKPGSLEDSEVYGLTAYLLYLNRIVAADVQLDRAALANVVMPARDRFDFDDREILVVR